MLPSAMGATNGPEMTMGTADAQSTAISCEGAGAALCTYLRAFRGVHKQYLYLYVATYEAMLNAKQVTPQLIRRMCVRKPVAHTSYI
jgi:hypothetical protein